MATFNKFNCFTKDLAEGVHDFSSHTLKVALCAHENIPLATNTILADLTQITYDFIVGNRELLNVTSTQSNGIYTLDAQDVQIYVSGGTLPTFRHIVIYNDSNSNGNLIGFADYGSDVTLLSTETFVIGFAGTGILTIT